MIHLVLVVLGAAAGSMGFIAAWQHRWGWRTMLAFNAAVSAMAGAVAGALYFASPDNPLHSLLSYGLVGTAAPLHVYPPAAIASAKRRGRLAPPTSHRRTPGGQRVLLRDGRIGYLHAHRRQLLLCPGDVLRPPHLLNVGYHAVTLQTAPRWRETYSSRRRS